MSFEKCVTKYENYLKFENVSQDVAVMDVAVDKTKEKTKVSEEKIAEISEVQQLDFCIIPVSKRSEVIENLYFKRRIRHDSLMKKLSDDLNELNLKIQEDIGILSEEVKAHIKNDKTHLAELLKSLNIPEVASYHETVFFELQKKADEIKSRQLQLIRDLYGELNKMEDRRAEENEKIFSSIFKNIENNAYISSYEVQYFAEQEALKMNQLSLNNRRCFEDLKLKLVLGSEHTFKTFMDEVFCLREKWLRYNAQEAWDNLERNKTDQKIVSPEPETRMELKGCELILQHTLDKCYNMVREEEWFENVQNVINTVENYKIMIADLFKRIKLSIRKSMSSECDDVRKALISLDVLEFEVRTIQPILFEKLGESGEDIEELENFWQDSLKKARNTIKGTVDFLVNFGDLWTRHNRRICESKILVLKAVEKSEGNNGLLLQDLEAKLNLNLDLLRQESNKEKLDIIYNTVVRSLDAIKDRIQSDYISEASVVEEFYNMMNLEADVLSSDIREFVHSRYSCSPNEEYDGENQFDPEISDTTFGALIRDFLSGINSLKFWKYEISTVLECFSNNARENTKWRADDWVRNKVREISMKYQTKVEMHSKRYGRVRIQIYEVRLEEIRVHEKVFDEHKAEVDDICKTLIRESENVYEKALEKLDMCKIKAESTVDELKKEEKAEVVRCVQTQMIREKCDFIKDFTFKSEQVRGEIELKIFSCQQSNLKFMKSIKIFHENGNYDADEAKTYIGALENIDREIGIESKRMIKDVDKKESNITQKANEVFDEAIRKLSQLYEELKFNSDVENAIRVCRTDFRSLESDLKSDFDVLIKQYDSVIMSNSNGKAHLSEEQNKMWIILINSLYKNICNIFHELEPPNWQDDESNNEEYSCKVHVQYIQAKIQKNNRPLPKSDCLIKDFAENLFETNLFSGTKSSFVNTVCNKMLLHMSEIQRMGCLFYKNVGTKPLIRKDLLKPNYEDFTYSILRIFHLFAAESEQFWLKTIQDFLPLLDRVKTLFRTYFERLVREYCERVIDALDNYYLRFTECSVENEWEFLNELQNLDNRLLSLHGHPRNKPLLDSLEEEVVQRIAQLEMNWELFIKKYKNELKRFRVLHVTQYPEWRKLQSWYSESEKFLFSGSLGKDMVQFLQAVTEKGGFLREVEKIGVWRKESVSNSVVGVDNSQDNQILVNIDTYLSEIKQIIDRQITDAYPRTESKFLNESELRIDLLQEPENFDELVAPYITGIEVRYRKVKEIINVKSNFHKQVIFEWLDKWKMNVATITDLYTVKYARMEESSDQSSESSKNKVAIIFMAELKTTKKKKIETSKISTLPKLSQKRPNNSDPAHSIANPKSRSVGNRSYSYEKRYPGYTLENRGKNVKSYKTMQTENKSPLNEKERSKSNVSLGSASPSKRQSQIPVLSRTSPITGRSRKKAASADTISAKTVIVSSGQSRMNNPVSNQSVSPSPQRINPKRNSITKISGRSRSSCTRTMINSKVKQAKTDEEYASETGSSQKTYPAASNINCNKSYTTITICSPRADSDAPVTEMLTPESKGNASSCTNEDLSPAYIKDVCPSTSMGKASSDCDFEACNNAQCLQPHCSSEYSKLCRLNNILENEPQLELPDLCLKDSESQLFSTVPGSTASSSRLDDLQTPKTTIRTISGEELVFSSSMEFDIENDLKTNVLENEDAVKELLEDVEGDSFVKAYSGIHLIEDDADEYDSEGTTDADIASESKRMKRETDFNNSGEISPSKSRGIAESLESKLSWRSRENEFLADINYRQFLYHPTVMRRKTREGYKEERMRSKSIDDGSNFRLRDSEQGKGAWSKKTSFKKKNNLEAFVSNRDVNITPLRTWSDKTPQEERQIYDSLQMMQNTDYVLKEIKRERTKRERITAAVLKITAKFIHLLAIFNLWPGDNCQLLTSQKPLYGR